MPLFRRIALVFTLSAAIAGRKILNRRVAAATVAPGSCRRRSTRSLGLMVRVRPFEEKDRPALAAIYQECRSEATWLPTAVRESNFTQETDGEALLVAVGSDDEPRGFISVWEPEAFIHHLYVRTGARQKGIGKQLLESLRSRLPKPWRLKCARANEGALAFYLGQGWLEIASGVGDDGPYVVLEQA